MRPSKDKYFMSIALLAATRATCARRSVGCILINARGHVLSTGYNGPAAGQGHCIDSPCPGADLPSGTGLDACEALHAEQNALLQCRDVWQIHTAYVTTSPCVTCTKLLLNTSCERIVYLQEYPHPAAKTLWESAGRKWEKYSDKDVLSVIGVDVEHYLAQSASKTHYIREWSLSDHDVARPGQGPVQTVLAKSGNRPRVYVCSRASKEERPAMWRDFRALGANIVSTWIDEAGEGQTEDMSELWSRIAEEVAMCDRLVVYVQSDDLPVKGVYVEVGMALAFNKPVFVFSPDLSKKEIGSWLNHPLVTFFNGPSVSMYSPLMDWEVSK